MMIHYCNRLVRWQLHNIQPLRTFFQSGNVKNALRLYITCIETQGENSNCAVPLYFTRNPCAPHRPVTADDRLCLLGYSKTLLSTGCSRTSSAASFRCLTPSGSSLYAEENRFFPVNAFALCSKWFHSSKTRRPCQAVFLTMKMKQFHINSSINFQNLRVDPLLC